MEQKKRCIHPDFPAVLRNKITDWKILNYTKDDWCKEFKGKPLRFRQGRQTYTEGPYWEHLCKSKQMTLERFFELSSQKLDYWLYFDYKYMKDLFPDNKKFLQDVTWGDVGLANFSGEDSALWIGNEGAHTPCHMDTYGCNFVAQIYGRKLWILIPPEESDSLGPTRVPYEESSIYSSVNFYTPTESLLAAGAVLSKPNSPGTPATCPREVKKIFKIILSPGDVLYVPKHWWHYVENLEVSISVNVWVPLESDHEDRLGESLVQHYISSICQDLTETEAKQLLNPNEYNILKEPCTITLIKECMEECKKSKQENTVNTVNLDSVFKNEFTEIKPTDIMSYVNEKNKSLNYKPSAQKVPETFPADRINFAKRLINAYCQPSNIRLIRNSLTK